jgi:CheY-like chemotaxis protein
MHKENSKNILLANDSLFFRIKLSNALIWAGHSVNIVESGKEVVDLVTSQSNRIDLLILDLQTPDFDGLDLLKWIMNNGYAGIFPILVVTGAYEEPETIASLEDIGATGFISKSLAAEQIIFKVNRLLFADKTAKGVQRERMPVCIPVDFTSEKLSATGTIINISESGAFLYTGAKLEKETKLDLKFSLPGIDRILNIKAVLKWSVDSATDYFVLCGYGVMFASVPEDDQEIIRDFIITRL